METEMITTIRHEEMGKQAKATTMENGRLRTRIENLEWKLQNQHRWLEHKGGGTIEDRNNEMSAKVRMLVDRDEVNTDKTGQGEKAGYRETQNAQHVAI